MSETLNLVEQALESALKAGASEVKSWGSRGLEMEMEQRSGRLVKTTEATSRGLALSMLVDDRFSSHSTSDLRPEAVEIFVRKAVEATRTLEPDTDRRLADLDLMGAQEAAPLDLEDNSERRTAQDRRDRLGELEATALQEKPENLVSATFYGWEVRGQSWAVFSNGFSATSSSTHFGWGGEVTLKEDSGKLPEATAFYSARHLEDVPDADTLSRELWTRAGEGMKAGPTASGRYPMILANRAAGRFIGSLLGPLSGGAVWQGRSVFADRLGEKVTAENLTIWDEPAVPRGLGTRLHDGDGLVPRRRALVENGVINDYLMDVYHARKLNRTPTGGSVSNVVIAPGERSWQEIAADHPKAIRVTSFLGGNSNSSTGEFSFGIRGQLLENGIPAGNLSEMNVSGNLLDLYSRFQEAANDPWGYSAYRLPSLLFKDVQFSGS
jgi:PmbA protein